MQCWSKPIRNAEVRGSTPLCSTNKPQFFNVAPEVSLEVTGIEVICHVEYFDSNSDSIVLAEPSGHGHILQHLQIERSEVRKASRAITRPDEVAILVND